MCSTKFQFSPVEEIIIEDDNDLGTLKAMNFTIA